MQDSFGHGSLTENGSFIAGKSTITLSYKKNPNKQHGNMGTKA